MKPTSGSEHLLRDDRLLGLLANRSLALLTHDRAVDGSGIPSWRRIGHHPDLDVALLVAPEHGIGGTLPAMGSIARQTHPVLCCPVIPHYAPDIADHLSGVEVLIVDLNDPGVRYFTYASTAHRALKAAFVSGLERWVLDRPNPLGDVVEGPLPSPGSGYPPFPARHGLTLGEMLLATDPHPQSLHVVPAGSWSGREPWPDWRLPWRFPSPNLGTFGTALLYVGTCLFEGTDLSWGGGTKEAYRVVGSPDFPREFVLRRFPTGEIGGVRLQRTEFVPTEGTHRGSLCRGLRLAISDPLSSRPLEAAVTILTLVAQSRGIRWVRGSGQSWRVDELLGRAGVIGMISDGHSAGRILCSWRSTLPVYHNWRRSKLLYPPTS